MKRILWFAIALCSLAACQSKSVYTNDPKLKSMIDSMVRVRVVNEVQASMHQYILRQQNNADNSNYRRMAREEAERVSGRAAQDRQSQEDAIMNAQHNY